MRNRKRLCLAAFVTAVLMGAGWWCWEDHRQGVTKANFDRITDGMTEQEVIGLLGEPTYDWSARESRILGWCVEPGFVGRRRLAGVWISEEGVWNKYWNDYTWMVRLPWR